MVKVYFETLKPSHAELVAIFDDEDTYWACYPALEELQKKHNWDIITESIVDEIELNEAGRILNKHLDE